MAKFELVMPKMGESIIEATIIRWTKQVGESIALDEVVLEIATDKVDSEVPSPAAGILLEHRYKEGDVVPVGAVIATLETEAASGASPVATAAPAAATPAPSAGSNGSSAVGTQALPVQQASLASAVLSAPVQADRFYSPLVMNIAKEEKIGMDELSRLPGTGAEGRVTKKDILAYVEQKKAGIVIAPSALPAPVAQVQQPVAAAPASAPKVYATNGDVEIIEMDRMRKLISENMVRSKQISPHVTSFVEADVTPLVRWRDKVKDEFERKYGQKLTFTPLFMEVVARALRDFPMVNISVDGDKIIRKKNINLGMAVALPSGNLIVPVIKNADQLNLAGLAKAVNDLTARARAGKLTADDLSDGTYSVSNVGTFGNVMGTPIILQPQCAILATGAIRKKPAVLETPEGDVIAIRQLMFLSHSYDHRVIDGSLGGQFVRRVGDYLEKWDSSRTV